MLVEFHGPQQEPFDALSSGFLSRPFGEEIEPSFVHKWAVSADRLEHVVRVRDGSVPPDVKCLRWK